MWWNRGITQILLVPQDSKHCLTQSQLHKYSASPKRLTFSKLKDKVKVPEVFSLPLGIGPNNRELWFSMTIVYLPVPGFEPRSSIFKARVLPTRPQCHSPRYCINYTTHTSQFTIYHFANSETTERHLCTTGLYTLFRKPGNDHQYNMQNIYICIHIG